MILQEFHGTVSSASIQLKLRVFYFFLNPCRCYIRYCDVTAGSDPAVLVIDGPHGTRRNTIKSTVAVTGIERMKNA